MTGEEHVITKRRTYPGGREEFSYYMVGPRRASFMEALKDLLTYHLGRDNATVVADAEDRAPQPAYSVDEHGLVTGLAPRPERPQDRTDGGTGVEVPLSPGSGQGEPAAGQGGAADDEAETWGLVDEALRWSEQQEGKVRTHVGGVPPSGYSPEHLGRSSEAPVDRVDLIPWSGGTVVVTLDCTEFTSLCPVTGHPDFGRLVITYSPAAYLIETKSLKLYLRRWRDRGAFNEAIVAEVAGGLYEQVQPRWLRVEGRFNVRGGIAPGAVAVRKGISVGWDSVLEDLALFGEGARRAG